MDDGRIKVQPEVAVEYFPPGGIYFTVFIAVLDAVFLDAVTIFNFAIAGHRKFAATLTAIVVMSFGLEAYFGHLCKLKADVEDTIETGIMPSSLLSALSREKGTEAPMSLALTTYAFGY